MFEKLNLVQEDFLCPEKKMKVVCNCSVVALIPYNIP